MGESTAAVRSPVSWFAVDRDWKITAATPGCPMFGPAVGQNLWDLDPQARRHWGAACETAWRTGRAAQCVFHRGALWRATGTRHGDLLQVEWEKVAEIDEQHHRINWRKTVSHLRPQD